MARFGQAFINQLTSPGYGQGLFNLGSAIGSAPAVAREKQARSSAMQVVNEALASNDPTQLLAAAKSMQTIDPDISVKLAQAAGVANKAKKAAQIKSLEEAGAESTLKAQTARALQMAGQAKDTMGIQQIRSGAISPADYINKLADASRKPKDPSEYSFSEETIMVDGTPTRVQVAVNKNNPSDRKVYSIGDAAAAGTGEAAKPTLGRMLKDAGFEADLSTLKGVQQARRFAITDLGNAALAGQLADLEKQMTPFSLQQSIETVRAISPDFKEAESMLEKTERYRALDALNDQDVAGLTALLERTITSTTENDLKAVAELSRFRGSKDLVQRIKDFSTMTISGELSDETLTEYRQIMDAVDALSRMRVLRAADQTILLGSEREKDAAMKVRELYETEDNQARFVN